MKKFVLFLFLSFYGVIYGTNHSYPSFVNVVEISDSTLSKVVYHKESFIQPTVLVYTNLTSVEGFVYFHENQNLLGVEFPKLAKIGEYFYFHQNLSLEYINTPKLKSTGESFYFSGNLNLQNINAPGLTSVGDYLYVHGHRMLEELNICELKEIKQTDERIKPYYYISDNNQNIDDNLCFAWGPPTRLKISNNSIAENLPLLSFVAKITSENNLSHGALTYYLDEFEEDNEYFAIINENELVTNAVFDSEAKNEYQIKIGAMNVLGEKLEKLFQINVQNVIEDNDPISQQSHKETVNIFPNPSSEIIEIESEIEFDGIRIYDLSGNLVKSFKSNTSQYDISDMASGMYLMVMSHRNSSASSIKKIVVQ